MRDAVACTCRKVLRSSSLAIAAVLLTAAAAAAQQRLPTIEDVLAFTDVTDVVLAPQGDALLYVTRRADPASDRHERDVWLMRPLTGTRPARLVDGLAARSPQWLPDGRISLLGTSAGRTRLYVLDSPDAAPRVVIGDADGVLTYAWSPDGRRIAYTRMGSGDGFEEDAATARRGIVVSKWDFIFYRLFGNAVFAAAQNPVELWIHDVAAGTDVKISGNRSVADFAWSPSSAHLAFTAAPSAGMGVHRSDLLLYSTEAAALTTLLEGSEGHGYDDSAVGHSQPVWSPDGRRLAFVRSGPSVIAVLSLGSGDVRVLTDPDALDLYRPSISWRAPQSLLVEMHLRGQRGLFVIDATDGLITPVLHGPAEASLFSFAADGTRAAWVQQATDRPPEIHIGALPFTGGHQATRLNAHLDSVWLPPAEAISWKSGDGTTVHGWLLKPRDYRDGQRYPLLTLVHGGPVFAVTNRFQLYPAWEYAAQVLAARGYAVFLPNYRGTGSYGMTFRSPPAVDREPVDDVLTGVRHLVEVGIADAERLGIFGQSYGAWLGPMIVIRDPAAFRVASFAEGMVDYISAYSLVPGWHILGSYESDVGNPYQHTQRYIELSPMFHLAATATPTLIEAGQQSLALQALKYATALWRHAIPHELVIYPQTGHNIASPALTLDSVRRNLDWFDFWLLDRRDADPEKGAQYRRWQAMRDGEGFPPPP